MQDDLADRLVDHLLETRHVGALLVCVEVDEALGASRRRARRGCGRPSPLPCTPTRESPTAIAGALACTSSAGVSEIDALEVVVIGTRREA